MVDSDGELYANAHIIPRMHLTSSSDAAAHALAFSPTSGIATHPHFTFIHLPFVSMLCSAPSFPSLDLFLQTILTHPTHAPRTCMTFAECHTAVRCRCI